MSWFEDGLATVATNLKAWAGRSVTYKRGVYNATLTVSLGMKKLLVEGDSGGSRIIVSDRDYLIEAADLILNSVATLPEKGDQITDANDPDGQTRTWEVLSPDQNEEPWQWADAQRSMLIVHCKMVRPAR